MKRIAIISTNINQYSESFIRTQIEHLPFSKIVFSGGYLPTKLSKDGGKSFQSIARSIWKRKPEDALKSALKKEKIDVVLAEYGPSGVAVMNICNQLKIPLIVHFHGYDAYRDDVLSTYGQHYSELFKNASACIAVSLDMQKQLITLGCPQEKVSYIPYGIDVELFHPDSVIQKKLQWLACGRFVQKKSPKSSIQAFVKVLDIFPEAQLHMIGDGELLDECRALVNEKSLNENVQFLGVLSQHEIASEMKKSIGFVQHSIKTKDNDSEGTPLSVLEAMASGLPVIATRHAGIVDVVVENKAGILVEEGNIDAMANAMIELMNHSDRAKNMGKFGRETVLQTFTYQRYIDELTNLIYTIEP